MKVHIVELAAFIYVASTAIAVFAFLCALVIVFLSSMMGLDEPAADTAKPSPEKL